MGAEFQVYRIKALTPKDVTAKYPEMVRMAQHEYGHGGYTGTIAESPGLSFNVNRVFYTEELAEQWLVDNCRKWEDTLAVCLRTDDGQFWLLGGLYSC